MIQTLHISIKVKPQRVIMIFDEVDISDVLMRNWSEPWRWMAEPGWCRSVLRSQPEDKLREAHGQSIPLRSMVDFLGNRGRKAVATDTSRGMHCLRLSTIHLSSHATNAQFLGIQSCSSLHHTFKLLAMPLSAHQCSCPRMALRTDVDLLRTT